MTTSVVAMRAGMDVISIVPSASRSSPISSVCGRIVGYSSGAVCVSARRVTRSPSASHCAPSVFSDGVSSHARDHSESDCPLPASSDCMNCARVAFEYACVRK